MIVSITPFPDEKEQEIRHKKTRSGGFFWVLVIAAKRKKLTRCIPTTKKTKGLPFGNPLFNLAEAQRFE
ncbi:TPA: hypothetical protein ACXPG1_005251, partial [Citrobacter amalonaticus]